MAKSKVKPKAKRTSGSSKLAVKGKAPGKMVKKATRSAKPVAKTAKPAAQNTAKPAAQSAMPAKSKPAPNKPAASETKPVLLTGGNPQIAKAEGDAPVQAYIQAMPGWKRDLGQRLDALITRHVPNLHKAIKWNSPFYGVEGQGWFLSFHVFTRYVKVTFFKGLSLRPTPPGGTVRSGEARWIDIQEGEKLDEKQMESWLKQAAAIPGWLS